MKNTYQRNFLRTLVAATLLSAPPAWGISILDPAGSAIPGVEVLFSGLLGSPKTRAIYMELILVTTATYLLFVLIDLIKSGTFSVKNLKNLKTLFKKKGKRPLRSDGNELGSGDLATAEQIEKWTKTVGLGDTLLDVTNLRGSEGIAFKKTKLVISKDERNRHVLIIAKTGSGKTTKLILPVLYSDLMCPVRSTVIIDSKPEMWQKLAAMAKKYNPEKELILFNPLDTGRSLSWNILAKIENDTDAKLIANTIIMATDAPGSKGDSPFFRNNALAILNALMGGLLHDPNDVLSMPRIHELVQSGMKNLCNWLEAHPHALRTSRTFIELARAGSQNADTIMSELSMRLAAWDLSAIRATTSKAEFDLETLVSKPSLFIVELRESELEMLRPMANVVVVEILRFLTKRAESCPGHCLPRPVGLVIDEFASALGKLPDIHVKLNTLRSRNVSIVAAIQSTAQVKANYGDDGDSVLAGFSTKIFMPALDLVDSEFASKESGQMTIRFKTASLGKNKKLTEAFASKNDSTQEQVQQRAVLTADEIGRPVDNIATFFMPNTPVFQGFLTPYYESADLAARFKEFSRAPELQLRSEPIYYEDKLPEAGPPPEQAQAAGALPQNITDTTGWEPTKLREKLEELKAQIDYEGCSPSAKKWWLAFEGENDEKLGLVFRLAEELKNRKATVNEFFLAYVYSNTDNIMANLNFMDYTRLKKAQEKARAQKAAAQG